jgi:pimeloyl-ACP methyl ester carboxylesterase
MVLALLINGCAANSSAAPTAAPPAAPTLPQLAPTAVATEPPLGPPTQVGLLPEGPVSFETEDKVTLAGTIFGQGKTAVILAHMQPSDQTSWQPFAKELAENGFTALTFDFRGYGKSGGKLNLGLLDRDVRAAETFLRGHGFTHVVCIGASMGGTACAKAALMPGLDGLVVISGPISMQPPLALRVGDFKQLTLSKLFVAAKGDPGYAESVKTMYDLSPDPKQIELLPGSAHGTDILRSPDGEALRKLLVTFAQAVDKQ